MKTRPKSTAAEDILLFIAFLKHGSYDFKRKFTKRLFFVGFVKLLFFKTKLYSL
jgi:hypothetical protein